jgi:hypothetical protein
MKNNHRSSSKVVLIVAIALLLTLPLTWRSTPAQEPLSPPAPPAATVTPDSPASPDAMPDAVDRATPDPTRPDPLLVRVTSSLESKYAAAMLRQVARLFSAGFARRDAEMVAHQIDVLPADQKQLWQFAPLYKGVSYRLQIRARVDDFGMLDLDFYVPEPLSKPVRSAVDDFLNKHGG